MEIAGTVSAQRVSEDEGGAVSGQLEGFSAITAGKVGFPVTTTHIGAATAFALQFQTKGDLVETSAAGDLVRFFFLEFRIQIIDIKLSPQG